MAERGERRTADDGKSEMIEKQVLGDQTLANLEDLNISWYQSHIWQTVSYGTIQLDLKNDKNLSLPKNKVNEYQPLENVSDKNLSLPSSITRSGSEVVKLADKKKRNDKSQGEYIIITGVFKKASMRL